MAPELLVEDEELNYDDKADIWSLGCILFELCDLQYVSCSTNTQVLS
jgi:serine/threonine protein kinase